MKNIFGHIIAGSHPLLREETKTLTHHAVVLHSVCNLERFYAIESLGIMCQPKCGSCKCGKCHLGGKDMSLQDEKELEMIAKNLSYDKDAKKWTAAYPWIQDPVNLPDNKYMIAAMLKSTIKRLSKNNDHLELYERQIQDMLQRGAARLVAKEELQTYDGPKFYIPHHAVLKPTSSTTPCRIVFNSSAKCYGKSLNDFLAKGPSLLNHLLGVLLRFRQGNIGFICDISKMFHSINIPLHDQMTHLFLWNDETYAMTVVNMGDKPSATIAQTVLRKTAEINAKNFPTASQIIVQNSYMDDIPASVSNHVDAKKVMRDIEIILHDGGFKIKGWHISGDSQGKTDTDNKDQRVVQSLLHKEEIEDEGNEKVLGMNWNTESDSLFFNVKDTIDNSSGKLTKRVMLSKINSIFDPLGLLSPCTIKAKMLLRRLWANFPSLNWDDEIPDKLKVEWQAFFEDFLLIKDTTFRRALTPANPISLPILIIFSDASVEAYGAVAYIRWKTEKGYQVRLIMSKTRIAPLKIIDIVKLELCGAVLGTRIRTIIQNNLNFEFKKVYHLVDSEIVKGMTSKESYGFRTFAANRIGEIQQSTDMHEWAWIRGPLNVADYVTRGLSSKEINSNSIWQQGPDFLYLPEEEWPISRQCTVKEIPELKLSSNMAVTRQEDSLSQRLDIDRFSKYMLLINTTQRVLDLYLRFRSTESNDNQKYGTEKAEIFWIKDAQKLMEQDISTGKLAKLVPHKVEDIWFVGGRTIRFNQATWNNQEFILLPHGHHFSYLLAEHKHRIGGHLRLNETVSQIRSKYWIVGLRAIVRRIHSNCLFCKIKNKRLAEQVMS